MPYHIVKVIKFWPWLQKNPADKHFLLEKDQRDQGRGNEYGLGFARLLLEFPVKIQTEKSSVTGGVFYSAGGEKRQGQKHKHTREHAHSKGHVCV